MAQLHNISEKFKEDSDPIYDMGIGSPITKVKKMDILQIKKYFPVKSTEKRRGSSFKFVLKSPDANHRYDYTEFKYWVIFKIIKTKKGLYLILIPWVSLGEAKNFVTTFLQGGENDALSHCWYVEGEFSYSTWDKYFKVKDNIFEKFEAESDPIRDLGIGLIKYYEQWLKENIADLRRVGWNTNDADQLLRAAVYRRAPLNVIEYLLSSGADVNTDDGQVIVNATRKEYLDALFLLFKYGADYELAYERVKLVDGANSTSLNFLEKAKKLYDEQKKLSNTDEQLLDNLFDDFNVLNESINFDKIVNTLKKLKDKSLSLKRIVQKYNLAQSKNFKYYLALLMSILLLIGHAEKPTPEKAQTIKKEIVKRNKIQKHDLIQISKLTNIKTPKTKDISKTELANISNPIVIKTARTSREGKLTIKDHEKLRLEAYALGDNMITIGYGHAEYKKKSKYKIGDKITQEKAEELFRIDLNEAETAVKRIFSDWEKQGIHVQINQGMFDAMVSMAFNMGATGLRATDFIQALKKRHYKKAAELIKISALAKIYPGLQVRRDSEHKLFTKNMP